MIINIVLGILFIFWMAVIMTATEISNLSEKFKMVISLFVGVVIGMVVSWVCFMIGI